MPDDPVRALASADHGDGATTAPVDVIGGEHPRATPADAARTIIAFGRQAMLATLTDRPAGFPFGSLVSYGPDVDGHPLMVISTMAEHTRNATRDPRSSMLVTEVVGAGHDPLDAGRVTLLGELRRVPDEAQAEATAQVVASLPAVGRYADFGDFACWRFTVASVRWVGGFGSMGWVDVGDYFAAAADAGLVHRRAVLDHMNTDHADACLAIVGHALRRDDLVAAEMTGVDRFGCDYHAITIQGMADLQVRVPFQAPVSDVVDVRRQLVEQTRVARLFDNPSPEASAPRGPA